MKDKNDNRNNLKLQQTVRFFEALLRASADGIVIIDPSKNIIFVNDTFCKIFGSFRQDVIETNLFVWLEKLNPNARDIWNALDNQINEHGIARDVEFSMKAGKGMRYFSINSSLLEKVDIEETGLIISIWHDITERKMAQEALKRAHDELEMRVEERTVALEESEAKYRKIFEYSNDIIVQVDRFGKVLAVNNKLEEVFGFKPEEVMGKYFFNLGVLRLRDLPRIIALFKNTVRKGMTRDKSGKLLEKVEIELRDKKGNFVFVETSTTILKNDGTIEGFLTNIRDITQSKKAEQRLKASEEKYSTLVEKGNDGIIILQDNVIKFVNSIICTMTGFTREELLGKPFLAFASPEYRKTVQERYEKRLGGDAIPNIYEIEIVSKNGLKTPIEINASRIEYEGRPASMAIIRDIRQRKHADETLRESEERYRTIVENSNDMIWTLDIDGNFLFFNKRSEQISGYKLEEWLGRSFAPLIVKEDLPTVIEAFQKTLKGQSTQYEVRFTAKNGTIVTLEGNSAPLYSKGKVVGTVTLGRDITERKQAEVLIKTLSLRNETILASVPDIIMEVDENKIYRWANKAGIQFFGDDVIGKEADYFFEGEQKTYEAVKPLFEGSEDIIYIESWQRRKDGEKRLLSWWCRVLKDSSGNVIGALSTARDITDRKQDEVKLKEANNYLDTVIKSSYDSIFVIDEEGKFEFGNEAFFTMMGYPEKEIVGQSFMKLIHPDYHEFILKQWDEVQRGEGKPYEVDIVRKDGEERSLSVSQTHMEFGGKRKYCVIAKDITEQKRMEEVIRESRSLLFNAFNNSPLLMMISDIDTGKYLEVNDSFCMVSGFTRDEAIGKTSIELGWIDEEERTRMLHELQEHGKVRSLELTLRSKGGKTVICRYSADIIHTAQGNKLLSTAEEITHRKQVEEELAKSREMLIKAQEIGQMGSWEWDLATNELVWSKEVYTIYGVDPGIYTPNFEIVNETLAPECKDDFLKAIDDALKMRKPFEGDYTIILLDGTIKFTHTKGEVVYGKEGNPIRMYGIVQDITERKRTQEALQRSEQHYHTILQTAMDGFWVVDIQGHIIEVNEAYCKIIGYSRDELLGMTIHDVESLETESEMRQHFQHIIDKGYDFFETRHRGKDGRIIDIEASVKHLPHEGILFVFMRDITQRKRAEESILASLEEKTVLLHEVHHRVKNNLQIVSSLLNLQATRIKNREAKEALRETANRIRSMAMLHETLNISGNLSRVNFSTYIKNICVHIISSYGSKAENIKLETHIAEIPIDLDQAVPCGLIVNELISNALKHAFPEGRKGRIFVELKALPDNHIMLTVADDGIGLPPGLDIAQTETLGLKLVTILTEKLNGSVEIIRDRGTTFHIMFKGKMNVGGS